MQLHHITQNIFAISIWRYCDIFFEFSGNKTGFKLLIFINQLRVIMIYARFCTVNIYQPSKKHSRLNLNSQFSNEYCYWYTARLLQIEDYAMCSTDYYSVFFWLRGAAITSLLHLELHQVFNFHLWRSVISILRLRNILKDAIVYIPRNFI